VVANERSTTDESVPERDGSPARLLPNRAPRRIPSFNTLATRPSLQLRFSAAMTQISCYNCLGSRGRPTGRDVRRQRRWNPCRCHWMSVSGWPGPRASRHSNQVLRVAMTQRVASVARWGLASRSKIGRAVF
jgi:hypothetical protein